MKKRSNEGTRTPKRTDLISEYYNNRDNLLLKDKYILLSKKANINRLIKDNEAYNKWLIDNQAYDNEGIRQPTIHQESASKKTDDKSRRDIHLLSLMDDMTVLEDAIVTNGNNWELNNNICNITQDDKNNDLCFDNQTAGYSRFYFNSKKSKDMTPEVESDNKEKIIQIIQLKKKP